MLNDAGVSIPVAPHDEFPNVEYATEAAQRDVNRNLAERAVAALDLAPSPSRRARAKAPATVVESEREATVLSATLPVPLARPETPAEEINLPAILAEDIGAAIGHPKVQKFLDRIAEICDL